MLRFRGVVLGTAACLTIIALLFGIALSFEGPRSALARMGIAVYLTAHGMYLARGDLRVTRDTVTATQVEIDDAHGRVLSFARALVRYDWRGLLGRSDRRYGIKSVELDEPALRLIILPDGSMNVSAFLPKPGAPSSVSGPPPLPFDCDVRIFAGRLDVENPSALATPGHYFFVDRIDADLALHRGLDRGTLHGRYVAGRSTAPIAATLVENDNAGFADAIATATGIAIAPPLDAFVSSPSFALEDGIADVRLRAFDAGYGVAGPAWNVSGQAQVRGARLRIVPLIVPVQDARGLLYLRGGYLGFATLNGTVAGLPVVATGSIRLVDGVRLALRVSGGGDLHDARKLFAFTRRVPIAGPFQTALRIDGPLGAVHIGGQIFTRATAHFAKAPFTQVRGDYYYHDNHVTVPAIVARYDGGTLRGNGDVELADPYPNLEFVATASLPASRVPIAANLNPRAALQAQMSVAGPASTATFDGFARTRGGAGAAVRVALAGRFGQAAVSALRVAWPRGDVTARSGYDQTDPANRTLFADVIASNAAVRLWPATAGLPGVVSRTSIPASSGFFNGVALIRGSDDASGALQGWGAVDGSHVRIASTSLDRVTLRARTAAPNVALETIAVTGRDVHLAGNGLSSIDPRTFAYALRFSGDARISGTRFANTLALATGGAGHPMRYALRTDALGGTMGAVGSLAGGANATIWAHDLDVRALRADGVPLDAGTAVVLGRIRPSNGTSTLSAAVSLANARYQRTPLAGDVDIAYAGGIVHALGRLDIAGTRADIRGDISGIGLGARPESAGLDLAATVRDGDVNGLLGPYLPSSAPVSGIVDATFAVRGNAAAPYVNGSFDVGAGTVRGVTFTATRGAFSYGGGALSIQRGSTQLGSTPLAFSGTYSPQRAALDASSKRLDLADINDFFAGYDAVEGTGSGRLAFSFAPHRARANGSFALHGAEVAGVPLGVVNLGLSGDHDMLRLALAQRGSLGASAVRGTVAFADHANAMPDLARASYDVSANAAGVDLGLVSRVTGVEDLGVRGQLDAQGRFHGTQAHPNAEVSFAVRNGYVRKLQLRAASGTLQSNGSSIRLVRGAIALPFGTATASGVVSRNRHVVGNAQVNINDLGGLASFAGWPNTLHGVASGSLDVTGTFPRPHYRAALNAGPGDVHGIAFDSLTAHAAYGGNDIEISDTALQLAKHAGTVRLSGTLPFELVPLGLGPANRPIALQLHADHVRLSAFDPVLTRFGTVDGTLDATAAASGIAGQPELAGTAAVRGGVVASRYQRTPLRAINADLRFTHDAIVLSNLSGSVGNGSFNGSGAAHVVPAVGLRTTPGLSYYATLRARNVPLDVPNWVSGNLAGDLSLTKPGSTPYLAGSIQLRDGVIPVSALYDLAATLGETSAPQPTKNIPGVPPLRPGHIIVYGGAVYPPGSHVLTQADLATPAPTYFNLPSLNLGLTTAVQNMRVRGGPLDLTADGGLAINGNVADPQLAGDFVAKRGQIAAYGITFRLQRGVLSFNPDEGVLPTLDATAVSDVSGDQISLDVSGRIDHLNTNFSSSQGKTPEEVLASMITGSDVGFLSGGVSQQNLGTAAQRIFGDELTRSILFPFSNALAESLNIEQVSLAFNELGQIVVDVRKNVTPTIALLYRSTTTAPITQSYGAAYRVRNYAALEISSTIDPTGLTGYQLLMRFTFK